MFLQYKITPGMRTHGFGLIESLPIVSPQPLWGLLPSLWNICPHNQAFSHASWAMPQQCIASVTQLAQSSSSSFSLSVSFHWTIRKWKRLPYNLLFSAVDYMVWVNANESEWGPKVGCVKLNPLDLAIRRKGTCVLWAGVTDLNITLACVNPLCQKL